MSAAAARREIELQDLTGLPAPEAVDRLRALELRPAVEPVDAAEDRDHGRVLDQIPHANSRVKRGQLVTLLIGQPLAGETPPTGEPSLSQPPVETTAADHARRSTPPIARPTPAEDRQLQFSPARPLETPPEPDLALDRREQAVPVSQLAADTAAGETIAVSSPSSDPERSLHATRRRRRAGQPRVLLLIAAAAAAASVLLALILAYPSTRSSGSSRGIPTTTQTTTTTTAVPALAPVVRTPSAHRRPRPAATHHPAVSSPPAAVRPHSAPEPERATSGTEVLDLRRAPAVTRNPLTAMPPSPTGQLPGPYPNQTLGAPA